MSRLVVGTRGLADWRSRLAEPEKQWRRGYSAFEAAVAWENAAADASGIPRSVLALFQQQGPELSGPELLVGIVEHKVALPFGRTASQNDVWALVKVAGGLLSLAVEAKAGEPFADLVSVWLRKADEGSDKPARLKYLLGELGIPRMDVSDVRYQLLHRTASALIEAERVGAMHAAMIVQSFRNPQRKSDPKVQLEDFRRFGSKFGAEVEEGRLVQVPRREGVQLYLGWVTCEPATDSEVSALSSNLRF